MIGLLAILYILFVVGGFLAMLAAKWPAAPSPWAERTAWTCWFIASLIWAVGKVGP